MPTEQSISCEQLRRIAAAVRWRGITLPQAQLLWQDMTPEDQQWWIAETRNIVTHAGLAVERAGA